ncbi:SseB family protein [Amnibacterium endophyticum]|uniref:SseB family protein n=1 Tax=Amnibacterium endophyticum TaxID=2109337 RepID=A0ABW4LDF4_9MICO
MTAGDDPGAAARGDSAGRPWEGRSFGPTGAFAADDGATPPGFQRARDAFRSGEVGLTAVVDSLRGARLLVPLVAAAGEVGREGGRVVDKSQELALVTVAGPDGRAVLPAFSSTAAMAAWNPSARPVPAPARQVALGAASDGTELVIVDPASPERVGLRRSALEALARDLPWTPPFEDPEVGRAIRAAVDGEPAVTTARVAAGDPRASLDGAEVAVLVVLHETLDQAAAGALVSRLQQRWAADPVVRARVDSMAVRLAAEFC